MSVWFIAVVTIAAINVGNASPTDSSDDNDRQTKAEKKKNRQTRRKTRSEQKRKLLPLSTTDRIDIPFLRGVTPKQREPPEQEKKSITPRKKSDKEKKKINEKKSLTHQHLPGPQARYPVFQDPRPSYRLRHPRLALDRLRRQFLPSAAAAFLFTWSSLTSTAQLPSSTSTSSSRLAYVRQSGHEHGGWCASRMGQMHL